MGPADDAERVFCIVPGSVFRPAASVSGWLALLPGQRPAARPPAARKETILAFRVRARSSGGRRGDQARALLTGEPHLVPIAPMGCRPSPVLGSLPPNPRFVNEQIVNSQAIAKRSFRNRGLALIARGGRDTPRLVGARAHFVRLRVFLGKQSSPKNRSVFLYGPRPLSPRVNGGKRAL